MFLAFILFPANLAASFFRLKHCLQADQARVTESNYKAAFNSLEDALSRLLPYHILSEEIPPDIEWHKGRSFFRFPLTAAV